MKHTVSISMFLVPLVVAAWVLSAVSAIAAEPNGELANNEENYVALRNVTVGETYEVDDLTLKRDIGIFRLRSGRVSFGQPILGRPAIAVFVGDGEFVFEPHLEYEVRNLVMYTGEETVREPFGQLVLCFTDDTYSEVKANSRPSSPDPAAADVLDRFRSRMRRQPENPRSRLEAMLVGEDMDNIEADILAALYNPNRQGLFNAYIFGKKYEDLRFHVRPGGALPQMLSNEEVALVNVKPRGDQEGVWYLAHLEGEYDGSRAKHKGSDEPIDVTHYRIDAEISKGKKINAVCDITFTALSDGERVLKFGLLPTLRVHGVRTNTESDLHFIQEAEDRDGSFYVVLPEPLVKGREYGISVQYSGEKVIRGAGGGNFSVRARTSWYPSFGAFKDRATFELSFRYPKRFTLVSVGKLVEEGREGKTAFSKWSSDIPLAVAGFNYGRFKKKAVKDGPTEYQIEGYAASRLPGLLQTPGDLPGQNNVRVPTGNTSPSRLIEKTMAEAQMSLRIFSQYFGAAPYGRIAITQQPEFSSGQSWPSLVYLPVSAFLDSTQRWAMLGSGAFRFAEFIQEVTPHEVAHQWWGHVVGWSSYHDQWISEGFSEFSAGLYLQLTEKKPDKYLQFLERSRDSILEKNRYGHRANDVGPVWMGSRLSTPKSGSAYSRVVYNKGGFVLHMLRQLMFDPKTGDQRFVEMMKDFVQTHFNSNASTEEFQRIVEKHMPPQLDLRGDGTMDWFFDQWVYGTEVPSYRFEYNFTPQEGGKVLLTGRITQSGVSDDFRMLVPVYIDFKGKNFRLGTGHLVGEMTQDLRVVLPQRPKRVLLNAYHDVLAEETVNVHP